MKVRLWNKLESFVRREVWPHCGRPFFSHPMPSEAAKPRTGLKAPWSLSTLRRGVRDPLGWGPVAVPPLKGDPQGHDLGV